jgi:predicted hotdog family 3-hydroxylacyl-ACP dehydratase
VSVLPPLAELLPHAAPMRLLERALAHDGERTVCEALPAASALFREPGGAVPSWLGIEYMAQCAAAHGGLLARTRGEGPRAGLFVGSRRLVFRCRAFPPDAPLRVSAKLAAARGDTLAFDCAVEDPAGGPPLVEGRLNVLLLRIPAGPA